MDTFAEEIERMVGEEEILGVTYVPGLNPGGYPWDDETPPHWRDARPAAVLRSWEEARPDFLYQYPAGFGCHSVYIWTASRVLLTGIYEDSTWLESVPRNPQACEPHAVGVG